MPIPPPSAITSTPPPPRPVKEELALMEARTVAKEVASKYIGRTAVPWIAFLVSMGVGSSYFLPEASLPAVIGLVSTAVMALIAMITGITGLKEKEDRPEFEVIRDLIGRLDRHDPPVRVQIEGEKVVVSHGENVITTTRSLVPPGPEGEAEGHG